MKCYQNEAVQARVSVVEGKYLQARYHLDQEPVEITVGRGENWSVLACKEVYAKAVKVAKELEADSCLFDMTAALELGEVGLQAAAEGIYGGAYKKMNAMSGGVEPGLTCYAAGEGLCPEALERAVNLARAVMQARNLVNRPANLLTPELFAKEAVSMMEGLPVEVKIFSKAELQELGFGAMLSVGGSSANDPTMTVIRYTGAPESSERLGYVGKAITFDTGGYTLKGGKGMMKQKGDMAGGGAVLATMAALAANRVKVNVTAVIPACENRISNNSTLPGDVITSLSGRTIEVLSTDAEGRLILCDGITWAIREEKVTRLVDVATLTGAIVSMLGGVATGVMCNDDGWFACLEKASARSGEKFWRIPDYAEYEDLNQSDYADVRNTTKDGCSAIAAGLFLKGFTQGMPWMHLDIAGTSKGSIWQHHVGDATGTPVSTLYQLAAEMA